MAQEGSLVEGKRPLLPSCPVLTIEDFTILEGEIDMSADRDVVAQLIGN